MSSTDCEYYMRQIEALEERLSELEGVADDLYDAKNTISSLETEIDNIQESLDEVRYERDSAQLDAQYYEGQWYDECSKSSELQFHLQDWEKVQEETGYGPEDVLEWFRDIKAQVALRVQLMEEAGINNKETTDEGF